MCCCPFIWVLSYQHRAYFSSLILWLVYNYMFAIALLISSSGKLCVGSEQIYSGSLLFKSFCFRVSCLWVLQGITVWLSSSFQLLYWYNNIWYFLLCLCPLKNAQYIYIYIPQHFDHFLHVSCIIFIWYFIINNIDALQTKL